MKILKLLNKIYLSIIILVIFSVFLYAEEQPVDIWSIDKNKKEKKSNNNSSKIIKDEEELSASDIYKMQSQKNNDLIEEIDNINVNEIKLIGLYDPDDHGLDIGMWLNSDGDQLKNIFTKLNKINLSKDAIDIMKISLLTNAYPPKKNISENEFIKLKSQLLIKNFDLKLIEEFIVKNKIINTYPKLTRYLVDTYLSEAKIKKACELFSKNFEAIDDDYLSKFNIYCLIDNNRRDEAQIIFDLKKEEGFKNKYFEKKINYLLGYSSNLDDTISEDSILEFHLAHRTNPNFQFDPKEKTNKLIWKYLSASNLLNSINKIEITDFDKIIVLEKATHNKNYSEEDLFQIYKQFQFNINQLLNAETSYKTLSNIEARALVYQRILLESEMIEKLKLLKLLKSLFKNDNIEDAFDTELKKFLKNINPTDIPDNLTSFYYTNIKIQETKKEKVKFNNEVLHQSKLVNYFNGDYSKSKIEKDIENFLKKIKKNKKYSFSKKDQMFLESLKADGIEISDKFDDLYKVDESEIPTDLQVMINNNEKGAALMRIVEVIGQDKLERIDDDTIYFIIHTLNRLNINQLRNIILLKVLPLKV